MEGKTGRRQGQMGCASGGELVGGLEVSEG